jgi:hypothetical protein
MKTFTFESEKGCPTCQGEVKTVELKPEFDPIAVFACPHCGELLWKPGLDPNDEGQLVVFDANAEEEGI